MANESLHETLDARTRRENVAEAAGSVLTHAMFMEQFVQRHTPVVVRGAVRDWPALRKWTPAFFSTHFGDALVPVGYAKRMRLANFIAQVVASTEERPAPYMYRLFIHEHLPALLPDLLPQGQFAFPRRYASPLMPAYWRRPDGHLKLLIGGVGGRFPVLHHDTENVHATITQVCGEKEFLLFPPGDREYLYPDPQQPNQSLVEDPLEPDAVRFPLLARAHPRRVTVHPGDMMFIPCGWWHTARSVSISVSVGMNILERTNWSGFVDEVAPAGRLRLYLLGLGWLLSVLERAPRVPILRALAPITRNDVRDPSATPLSIAQQTR